MLYITRSQCVEDVRIVDSTQPGSIVSSSPLLKMASRALLPLGRRLFTLFIASRPVRLLLLAPSAKTLKETRELHEEVVERLSVVGRGRKFRNWNGILPKYATVNGKLVKCNYRKHYLYPGKAGRRNSTRIVVCENNYNGPWVSTNHYRALYELPEDVPLSHYSPIPEPEPTQWQIPETIYL